jgi:hypothetical protein
MRSSKFHISVETAAVQLAKDSPCQVFRVLRILTAFATTRNLGWPNPGKVEQLHLVNLYLGLKDRSKSTGGISACLFKFETVLRQMQSKISLRTGTLLLS